MQSTDMLFFALEPMLWVAAGIALLLLSTVAYACVSQG